MSQSTRRNKATNGQTYYNNESHNGSGEKDRKHKSHNRKNVPKDVRNDLDKALVALCDVWFDEIKPCLIRNNVKVHVRREHKEQTSPRISECTHCDPASSSSWCGLCELLLGAATSIDSAVCQAAAGRGIHSPSAPPAAPAHARDSNMH